MWEVDLTVAYMIVTGCLEKIGLVDDDSLLNKELSLILTNNDFKRSRKAGAKGSVCTSDSVINYLLTSKALFSGSSVATRRVEWVPLDELRVQQLVAV